MALLDSIRNVIENIIPTADADVTKNYQITFTVQGTGDWDGLHTLTFISFLHSLAAEPWLTCRVSHSLVLLIAY